MPSLFDKLPFREAINALRERLAMPKPEFLRLDAANRSRSFTMARVTDLGILENIHDELSVAINNGETFLDFYQRIDELKERSGWTGTSAWHYRVVYDQNLGMAYSAGRVQQGQASGLRVWRYLPSISLNPRGEHEPYYNELYRMAPGSPVPPIDFGCNCGWEWVFEDELESMGIDPASLPVFNPPVPRSGFVWSATNYFDLSAAVAGSEFVVRGLWSVATNNEQHTTDDMQLVAAAAIEQVPAEIVQWFELAVETASTIAQRKFERVLQWAEKITGGTPVPHQLSAIEQRIEDALAVIVDDEQAELDHQVTLAALLRGRWDVKGTADTRG